MGFYTTLVHGLTAVFLDPPYPAEANRTNNIYGSDDLTIAHAVREWALEHGDNPLFRIALCGYEGLWEMPANWECLAWRPGRGYGTSAKGKANRKRERLWFSPHCLKAEQLTLGLLEQSMVGKA